MRLAVILAAFAIKSWLRLRIMPRYVGYLVLLLAICIAIIMSHIGLKQRKPTSEVVCSDPSQRRIDWDFELCEHKLRSASRASSPHEGLIA